MSEQEISYRYSEAFKQKVITEIESGKYRKTEASRLYQVSQNSINKWLRKYGKNHLIEKIVRVEMKGEADRLKQLETEKRVLESALAQAHLKIITLEATIEVAEEKFNIDFKKKPGQKGSKEAERK
jgi:transposase-like protein